MAEGIRVELIVDNLNDGADVTLHLALKGVIVRAEIDAGNVSKPGRQAAITPLGTNIRTDAQNNVQSRLLRQRDKLSQIAISC